VERIKIYYAGFKNLISITRGMYYVFAISTATLEKISISCFAS